MIKTILYFTDSTGFGGAEKELLHVLAGLDRECWRPVLFHHASPGLAPLIEAARGLGVKLKAVPPMPLGTQGAKRVRQFMAEIQAERPSVFHAQLSWPLACKWGLTAAVLGRVPVVLATVQLFMEIPYTLSARLQQRLLALRVDRFIAVSQALAQQLHRTFWIPQHKIQVIRNAIPVDEYQRPVNACLKQSLLGQIKQPLILTTARLDKQKGLEYLLKAAVKVPEAKFVLAGDGPERSALEAQAKDLGLENQVLFLGFRPDIPDLLACCDLFVLPSLYEGLSLSLIEAMAAGKPVIASAIGGSDEAILHGESGLLVAPGDPDALASTILRLLADPALARGLAAAGQRRVQKEFSAKGMVQRLNQTYEELLSAQKRPDGTYQQPA